jgi:hypothetical protein
MIEISTGVVFLLSSMYGSGTPSAQATAANMIAADPEQVAQVTVQDRKAVENYVRKEYADTPILIEIARCESTFSQFDKEGKVIRGRVNKLDVGVMQINEKYHAETAKKLGFDLYSTEGNVDYAKYLYETQGAAPWKASSKCWAPRDLTINK